MIANFLRRIVKNPLSLLGGPFAGAYNLAAGLNDFIQEGGFKDYNLLKRVEGITDSVVPGAFESYIKKETASGRTGQQIEQDEYTAGREDTQYQRGVEDIQAAGLNPAMMYGKGAQPAPSSSAAMPATGGSFSNLLELMMLPAQLENIRSQSHLNEATADEKESIKSLNEQLLAFNEKVNPLRVEAQEVSNNIGRSTVNKINAECDMIAEQMRKFAAEADTEATKQLYNIAAANLADAQAKQIIDMLPFSIALAEAQTQKEKALARLSFVQAAYQQKLLDGGFVDALISEHESSAEMQEVKTRIKTGKAFTVEDDGFLAKAWNFFAEASGLSHGVQAIDYILDKINVFAPMISKSPASATLSNSHDPFGYVAD